jgi:hypothetical protein
MFHGDVEIWSSNSVFVTPSLYHHVYAKWFSQSKIRLPNALTHYMSFLMRPHSSLGTYFTWRCRNLKFKLCFCDAVSISSCIRQVVFAIKNPTTQCFNALHELSNETSLVSGDLFFMEMSKFEVQVPFLWWRLYIIMYTPKSDYAVL